MDNKEQLESLLLKIWQEILGVEELGITDNFFDLGGDSLQMLEIQTRIENELNREIDLITLFQYSTIQSLVEYLSQESDDLPSYDDIYERAKKQKKTISKKKNGS